MPFGLHLVNPKNRPEKFVYMAENAECHVAGTSARQGGCEGGQRMVIEMCPQLK